MARVIRADQGGPKIVPAAVVDATDRARAIVEQAQARAAALLARAVEDGRAQGHAESAARLLALAQERDRMLAALEPQAVEIAMLAAKRVIGQELSLRPELVVGIVAPLLARVRRARQVTVRVHPDDRAALKACLSALCAGAELAAGLQVETDPALCRGDCVVVSDIGTLDARIETQLSALARALGVP
jgi:type III secretion system HrpE/YscL family protein